MNNTNIGIFSRAMSGAGYEGGEVGSHISYRCDEGKITIEDQMLPGSTSGSRRRQIILEPSWEWDPRPPLTSECSQCILCKLYYTNLD